MNLGPNPVNTTFRYLLNQSGTNITLGDNTAVNWNGANVVARTGTQTIGGVKTFTNNIVAVSFGNSASANFFGSNSSSNEFGKNAPSNTFGDDALSNSFGYGPSVNNSFGQTSNTNNFGGSAGYNVFGDDATISNSFGSVSLLNFFGFDANTNSFGDSADPFSPVTSNSFGSGVLFNTFGDNVLGSNYFGVNTVNNIFGQGSFTGEVNLILPQFNGLSSQAGKFGELRVSGSGLYVCTGATGGWRRTFLQSF
jgi:hypothetical protein